MPRSKRRSRDGKISRTDCRGRATRDAGSVSRPARFVGAEGLPDQEVPVIGADLRISHSWRIDEHTPRVGPVGSPSSATIERRAASRSAGSGSRMINRFRTCCRNASPARSACWSRALRVGEHRCTRAGSARSRPGEVSSRPEVRAGTSSWEPPRVAIGQHAPSKRMGISLFNTVHSGKPRAYNSSGAGSRDRKAGLNGRTGVHGNRVELER